MGTVLAVAFFVGICSGGCAPPVPEDAELLQLSPGIENEPHQIEAFEETPEVAGIPPQVPRAIETVPVLLERAAQRFGVNPQRMARIIRCESGFNPNAVSPGGHLGLAQFSRSTWAWASVQAGYGGASPFDPEASLMSAAWLMSQRGGWNHWSCK